MRGRRVLSCLLAPTYFHLDPIFIFSFFLPFSLHFPFHHSSPVIPNVYSHFPDFISFISGHLQSILDRTGMACVGGFCCFSYSLTRSMARCRIHTLHKISLCTIMAFSSFYAGFISDPSVYTLVLRSGSRYFSLLSVRAGHRITALSVTASLVSCRVVCLMLPGDAGW